ncbi:hypothetical protein [Clostridium sp.]|uniref:hypothetical protein n=1 Tax=Clostridium sp. TaxID=1506 RepID=UPI003D6DA49A
MATEAKIQLTSSELGILWMIYTSQSATLTVFNLFRYKTIDIEAQNILNAFITDTTSIKNMIINLFNDVCNQFNIQYTIRVYCIRYIF